MNCSIKLVPDEGFFLSGIIRYVTWNYEKLAHMVIFGSTGSGKTYLLKIILGRIGKHIPDSELIVCDYKSDEDFSFLNGSENFYRFDKCMKGLERVVQLLHERQQGITSDKHFICLVFDEWASFINNLDKKSADRAKQLLATLLMLGRSFNIHVIISQQRLDASYFASSRDNFAVVIGMGVLSKESVDMMFSDYKEVINRNKAQGHGSAIIGNQFKDIIVPAVRDTNKLQAFIESAVNRPKDESL
ncbi:MAG: DUF87 domain-containing protein [Lachnospiraceae bacterium]|nr:DUF87 domain-containing protein [Lachnospiraceae bacterium]